MNTNVKAVLTAILETFQSGDIPEAVAYSLFPIPNIPSARWSLINRIVMFLAGTRDARGIRQWNRENRYVKKGSKAFSILVPHLTKTEDTETGEEREVLHGFLAKPVFRYEDTDGEPLDYEQIELPDLPFLERAEEWGIQVQAIPGEYRYKGYYSSAKNLIALATRDECVFFHELAHCAHERIKGSLKNGQDPLQEIVAELSSQALCRLVGKTAGRYLGNSYRYIEGYAEQLHITPYTACLKVMAETEKVVTLILRGKGSIDRPAEKVG